jgi:hypothetical protein
MLYWFYYVLLTLQQHDRATETSSEDFKAHTASHSCLAVSCTSQRRKTTGETSPLPKDFYFGMALMSATPSSRSCLTPFQIIRLIHQGSPRYVETVENYICRIDARDFARNGQHLSYMISLGETC